MRRARRYTIDELSERTGVATRSIRYYQTLGLLPPPTVEGRTGYYGDPHVERIALIQELQAEGLNLQAIGWLLGGSAHVDSRELRELKRAMLDGWMTSKPEERTAEEIQAGLPDGEVDADVVRRSQELRLLEPTDEDGVWRVLLPPVLSAGQELAQLGMTLSLDRSLDVLEVMREHARAIADAYVDLFDATVLAPWDARGRPAEEWPTIRTAVDRMRPLAGEALLSVFRQAMADAVADRIGDMQPEPD